jgi:hypothetical protein
VGDCGDSALSQRSAVIIEPTYRGHRIEVNAVASIREWIRPICGSSKETASNVAATVTPIRRCPAPGCGRLLRRRQHACSARCRGR